MAEEIDLEKCNFLNFRSSVTLILTLDLVEVTLDRPEFQFIRSSPSDDLKIIK